MIDEKEIAFYFDREPWRRVAVATRQDAIGFNYRDKAKWFADHLQHISGTMLDIGCNVGNLAFSLRHFGVPVGRLRYTGIDIAEKSIDVAKSRNIPGTTFQVGSALDIDFPDNTFDAVTCKEVIEHIPDQQKAMREIARVLKPDGILVLSTPNSECKPWLFDERLRFFAWRMLGRKLVDKDDPLTLPELEKLMIENNLIPSEETQYYWYRPYHIFKGRLYWPPQFAFKGLLTAMKECKKISDSGHLTEEQKRYFCNNMLAVAKKKT